MWDPNVSKYFVHFEKYFCYGIFNLASHQSNQCDKILEEKVAQFFSKVAQKYEHRFLLKSNAFQNNAKVTQKLGYVCRNICHNFFSKIAQSCHTLFLHKMWHFFFSKHFLDLLIRRIKKIKKELRFKVP